MQLTDQLPQHFAICARRQCSALQMLAHVDGVVGTPHPEASGVDAHVWVPAKSRIQFCGVGQRLLIELVDIPGPGVRGRGQDQQRGGVQRVGEQLRRDHCRIQRLHRVHRPDPNSLKLIGITYRRLSLRTFTSGERPHRAGRKSLFRPAGVKLAFPDMAAPDSGEPPAVASHQPPRGAGPLDYFVRPFRRTGRYYARSWRDYLDHQPDELPVARPTLALAAQAFRDEIVLTGFRMFRPLSDTHVFERINREVRAALEFYGQQGYLDKPEEFFATPPPLTDVTVRPVKTRGRSYERMVFDSGYEPKDRRTGP